MTMKKVDRRSWMSGLGVAAAGLALGQASVSAQEPAPSTGKPFKPARHSQDAWFDALPGQHRVILDCTSVTGAGEGIGYANNVFNANLSGYQLENADQAVVLCLRHAATAFAFNNAMWSKYGATLGQGVPMGGQGAVAEILVRDSIRQQCQRSRQAQHEDMDRSVARPEQRHAPATKTFQNSVTRKS